LHPQRWTLRGTINFLEATNARGERQVEELGQLRPDLTGVGINRVAAVMIRSN